MGDTYFVEEQSGVVKIGPMINVSPTYSSRPTKINYCSIETLFSLLIICLASVLIVLNLDAFYKLIYDYSISLSHQDKPDYNTWGFIIILSGIIVYIFAGLFALTCEAATIRVKFAKILYSTAYAIIFFSICYTLYSFSLLGLLGWIILLVLLAMYAIGYWRFLIISSMYLNEDGPLWFKPLLYGCLAFIPLLNMGSRCKDNSKTFYDGCMPIEYFGSKKVITDWTSFTFMFIIALLAAVPFITSKMELKRN